jgi:hypothetical protein
LKCGTAFAAIGSASPVRGLRPVCALCRLMVKEPKAQFDPAAVRQRTDDVIEHRRDDQLGIAPAQRGSLAARTATSSDLVMLLPAARCAALGRWIRRRCR